MAINCVLRSVVRTGETLECEASTDQSYWCRRGVSYCGKRLCLGQKYTGKTAVWHTSYHLIKIPLKIKIVKSELRHFAKASRLSLKKTGLENISVHILPSSKFGSCDNGEMAYVNNDIKNSTLSWLQATQFYFFHQRQVQMLLNVFFYLYMQVSIGIEAYPGILSCLRVP